MKPTQIQMFYAAQRRVADGNDSFLYLVETGLTREDLASCIKRRPALWGRFSAFLDTLPARKPSKESPVVNYGRPNPQGVPYDGELEFYRPASPQIKRKKQGARARRKSKPN